MKRKVNQETVIKLIKPLLRAGDILSNIAYTGKIIGISGRGIYLLVNKKSKYVKGWRLYDPV